MKSFFGLIVLTIWSATPVLSWEGYDYKTGQYVDIEGGN